jgi:site-specific DNA-methyltransferase (adenine-specific)
MHEHDLPLDEVLQGDCVEVLRGFPAASVDLVFADPPYNLQLSGALWRPNMTRVQAVDDAWDQFRDFAAYDEFTTAWLQACRRVLKDSGSLWVIGTYHNIFRIGAIMQTLGFWILNDVVWCKTNPMPNFRGVRFTNAHETLIWASKCREAKYTFNYHAMKSLNGGKQMRSDWQLPICSGAERLRHDGKKAHSTQKPLALLYRVILATSNPGDVVLDPFFGTGTSGVVAKRLQRHWIGIEREQGYVRLARRRIAAEPAATHLAQVFDVRDRKRLAPRLPFVQLLEMGFVRPGQQLYFRQDAAIAASVRADGRLVCGKNEGSIHQLGKLLMGGVPCNGWEHWYYDGEDGALHPIDRLRQEARRQLANSGEESDISC